MPLDRYGLRVVRFPDRASALAAASALTGLEFDGRRVEAGPLGAADSISQLCDALGVDDDGDGAADRTLIVASTAAADADILKDGLEDVEACEVEDAPDGLGFSVGRVVFATEDARVRGARVLADMRPGGASVSVAPAVDEENAMRKRLAALERGASGYLDAGDLAGLADVEAVSALAQRVDGLEADLIAEIARRDAEPGLRSPPKQSPPKVFEAPEPEPEPEPTPPKEPTPREPTPEPSPKAATPPKDASPPKIEPSPPKEKTPPKPRAPTPTLDVPAAQSPKKPASSPPKSPVASLSALENIAATLHARVDALEAAIAALRDQRAARDSPPKPAAAAPTSVELVVDEGAIVTAATAAALKELVRLGVLSVNDEDGEDAYEPSDEIKAQTAIGYCDAEVKEPLVKLTEAVGLLKTGLADALRRDEFAELCTRSDQAENPLRPVIDLVEGLLRPLHEKKADAADVERTFASTDKACRDFCEVEIAKARDEQVALVADVSRNLDLQQGAVEGCVKDVKALKDALGEDALGQFIEKYEASDAVVKADLEKHGAGLDDAVAGLEGVRSDLARVPDEDRVKYGRPAWKVLQE